jgi:hypothetical protein
MHIIRHEERPPSDYLHASDAGDSGRTAAQSSTSFFCAKTRAKKVREKDRSLHPYCDTRTRSDVTHALIAFAVLREANLKAGSTLVVVREVVAETV